MRSLKSLAIASLCSLALLLGGCSMIPYGPQVEGIAHEAETTAVKDRRNFNDDKAALTAIALCDMSVGAFYRIANPAVQYGTIAICSGQLPNQNLNLRASVGPEPGFDPAQAPVAAPAKSTP